MKSLKKTILSLVGASALMLSAAAPAMATYAAPDYTDVTHSLGLGTITAVATNLLNLNDAIDASKLKIVYVDDILTSSELNVVQGLLNGVLYKANINVLKSSLNDVDVASGGDILTFEQFLNGNNVDLKDVISVDLLDGDKYLVFAKKH
jgi:hypothetical protein